MKRTACNCYILLFHIFQQKCASSNSGIFAFFAFITLNINVMVDFMFTVMVEIMITGTGGCKYDVKSN